MRHYKYQLRQPVFSVKLRIMLFVAEKQYEYQADRGGKYDKDRCPGCEASAFIIKPAYCELADALYGECQYGAEAVQPAAVT